MMQRNRKRVSLHGGLVAKSLLACLYVAAVGLGYIWTKNQIYRLGDEMKHREATLAAIEKRNAMLEAQLAQLKSPAHLELFSQHYRLGLVTPRENQIVRLYEPTPRWEAQWMRQLTAGTSTALPQPNLMVHR